jgi:hypothetical protein
MGTRADAVSNAQSIRHVRSPAAVLRHAPTNFFAGLLDGMGALIAEVALQQHLARQSPSGRLRKP